MHRREQACQEQHFNLSHARNPSARCEITCRYRIISILLQCSVAKTCVQIMAWDLRSSGEPGAGSHLGAWTRGTGPRVTGAI